MTARSKLRALEVERVARSGAAAPLPAAEARRDDSRTRCCADISFGCAKVALTVQLWLRAPRQRERENRSTLETLDAPAPRLTRGPALVVRAVRASARFPILWGPQHFSL